MAVGKNKRLSKGKKGLKKKALVNHDCDWERLEAKCPWNAGIAHPAVERRFHLWNSHYLCPICRILCPNWRNFGGNEFVDCLYEILLLPNAMPNSIACSTLAVSTLNYA
jgi:hypothetical protein